LLLAKLETLRKAFKDGISRSALRDEKLFATVALSTRNSDPDCA
jgi:hypothetical protein